ncbi:pyrimidine 5'-nucleotidase [Globomyces pollinis-pini]|nr:pyrimidine 5'-nucleotidase [Globomyces pollinis-pini]
MLVIPDKIQSLLEWSKDPKNNIQIKDWDSVANKIMKFNQQKTEHIHIIADFDMTLTKYWENGKRSRSSHGILEASNGLTTEMKEKLGELYKKYYPLEISQEITYEEKFKHMEAWWSKAHECIVESKISKSNLHQLVKENPVSFRPLLKEFIQLITTREIPLLVFSAGLADVLECVLQSEPGFWTDDMAIVSNKMIFDSEGICVGFEDPLIHTLNKNEAGVSSTVHAQKVDHRDNIILMGDSLGDLKMSAGIRFENQLTVGFLNHDVEQLLPTYMDQFDVVLINDTSLEWLILLISLLD